MGGFMRKDRWKERLNAFKGKECPEAVLMLAGAGQDELMRIAVAWRQTDITRAKRLSKLKSEGDEELWSWLWENVRYERTALLARIPGAAARTEKNLDALIANRILYPDSTLNAYVERYLRQRVLKLFAQPIRKRAKCAT
jgi:hypothetical protein